MKLLTKAIESKLIANYKASLASENGSVDHAPVVKFFGGGACTWLITEYNPDERTFFGLCDLGFGSPEIGYVSRDELEAIRFKPFGLPVERDMYSTFDKPLSAYTNAARDNQRIVSNL